MSDSKPKSKAAPKTADAKATKTDTKSTASKTESKDSKSTTKSSATKKVDAPKKADAPAVVKADAPKADAPKKSEAKAEKKKADSPAPKAKASDKEAAPKAKAQKGGDKSKKSGKGEKAAPKTQKAKKSDKGEKAKEKPAESKKRARPAKEEKPSKAKAVVVDAPKVDYPKPPSGKLSGYTFFFQERRSSMGNEHPDEGFGGVTKLVAKEWTALPQAKKDTYEAMAKEDLKRYERERAVWNTEVEKLGGNPDDVMRSLKDEKRQRKLRRKQPKAPKKGKNAYMCFCDHKRAEWKKANVVLDFNDMNKRLAEEWGKVAEADRARYVAEAEADKTRFEAEFSDFREKNPEQVTKPNRKRKGKDEPKGPKNAYIFYCDEERNKVAAENPNMDVKSIMSELGKRWGELASKDKFVEKAANDKARYDKEMDAFRKAKGLVTTK